MTSAAIDDRRKDVRVGYCTVLEAHWCRYMSLRVREKCVVRPPAWMRKRAVSASTAIIQAQGSSLSSCQMQDSQDCHSVCMYVGLTLDLTHRTHIRRSRISLSGSVVPADASCHSTT
jgi:hypothetical protein